MTGGAGYIGSHTVRALREQGEDVVVLDRLDHGTVPPTGARLVVADIADRSTVGDLLAAHDVDAILHFAARKSAPDSVLDPGGYFLDNVAGSLALLDVAARHGVRSFVFSSSCAVYGTPDRLPVTEAAAIRPENPYGESKALVERMLPWFGGAHGLRYASLRYFNAAGAHPAGDLGEDWTGAANLIPAVLRAAFTGQPVSVFGTDHPTPDGTGIRDYVHVVDLAEAHVAALQRLRTGTPSLVVNLGTGRGHSVRDVIETARRVTGRDIPVIEEPRRAGDPPAVWADPSLAESALGWRAGRGLDDMVESDWHANLQRHDASERVAVSTGIETRARATVAAGSTPGPVERR
ncbi:MAG TPA: UDP-glucose 4-epimerase GalE [Candidatus Limnocylindrales bacterium]|nr:UDP-glucose 4-epimerase GalE [Candidatus Limnocylindrales bacterium]